MLTIRVDASLRLSASHTTIAAGTYRYLSVNSSDNNLVVKLLSMALKTYPYDIERLVVIVVMGLHLDVSTEDTWALGKSPRFHSVMNESTRYRFVRVS